MPALAYMQYQWLGQLSTAERERMQRTLMYAPASTQKSPLRATVMAQRPASWIESEPEDGFIAQLLGSTKADAALLVGGKFKYRLEHLGANYSSSSYRDKIYSYC